MLFCSPHNPVGRVWNKAELNELLRIARRYDLTILSDEIHADLVYPGERHVALAKLAEETDKIITTVAPSKTFNIPGLGLSCVIASNAATRHERSSARSRRCMSATPIPSALPHSKLPTVAARCGWIVC